MKTNGKVKFKAIVEFEIDENSASAILSDPLPNTAIENWLLAHHPTGTGSDPAVLDRFKIISGDLKNLRDGLGRYLIDQRVATQQPENRIEQS